MSDAPGSVRRSRLSWPVLLGAALVVAAAVLAAAFLPVQHWLALIVEALEELGPTGAVLYVLVYAVAATVSFPASLLTMGAGFAYGPIGGLAVASPASVLAAMLSFWIAQRFARARVELALAERPRMRAVAKVVAEQGFRVVFLIRLSPIMPFALTNYSLGVTRLRFGTYVWGSFLGMLPGAFLYSYLGSTLSALARVSPPVGEADTARTVLFWSGLAATLLVTVLLTRAARRALRDTVDLPEEK